MRTGDREDRKGGRTSHHKQMNKRAEENSVEGNENEGRRRQEGRWRKVKAIGEGEERDGREER